MFLVFNRSCEWCSELGQLDHVHDWLDVSVVKLRNFAGVEAGVNSRVVLLLVDVSILVTDGRGNIAWDELGQVNNLWTQVSKSLSVGLLKKVTRALGEETSLIEQVRVLSDEVQSEVGEHSHVEVASVGILHILGLDSCTSSLVHDVDQVEASHSIHINGEDLVLLGLAGSLAL